MLGKVLITGGTGYVGGWVTEALLKAGYEVTVLSRKAGSQNVEYLTADITDGNELNQALTGKQFDIMVHLAAANSLAPVEKVFAVNETGTANLIAALQQNPPKKFIYLSTFHVYGQRSGHITETTPAQPAHPYGESKLRAENLVSNACKEWQIPSLIFRLSNAYGAPKSLGIDAWHLLFNDLCRSAFENQRLTLKAPPDTQLDMIWLGDVCEVLLKSLESSQLEGTFNLGFGKSITTFEVATAVAAAYLEYAGKHLPIIKGDAASAPQLTFDCNKLQQTIPYHPTHHFKEEAMKVFRLLERE